MMNVLMRGSAIGAALGILLFARVALAQEKPANPLGATALASPESVLHGKPESAEAVQLGPVTPPPFATRLPTSNPKVTDGFKDEVDGSSVANTRSMPMGDNGTVFVRPHLRVKPRVFVTSDIGGGDKDDSQSMVHLLLYADKLRIEGIGSTPTGGGGTQNIREVIDAYAKDYAKLVSHSADYPTPERLQSLVSQGSRRFAPRRGFGQPTEASKAIIAAARSGSAADPLYVLTWGSVVDAAQALHDAPDIANKIRLYTIGPFQQDANASRYLMQTWKGKVWWVDNQSSFRGMFSPESGASQPITTFSGPNAQGHGALGDYFHKNTMNLYENDPQGNAGRQPNGVKMGDTPSLLYLLDQADNNDPTADSWGGEFVAKGPNYWTDDKDPSVAFGPFWYGPSYGARTIAEHREEYLADFAKRLDRAKDYAPGSEPVPKPAP